MPSKSKSKYISPALHKRLEKSTSRSALKPPTVTRTMPGKPVKRGTNIIQMMGPEQYASSLPVQPPSSANKPVQIEPVIISPDIEPVPDPIPIIEPAPKPIAKKAKRTHKKVVDMTYYVRSDGKYISMIEGKSKNTFKIVDKPDENIKAEKMPGMMEKDLLDKERANPGSHIRTITKNRLAQIFSQPSPEDLRAFAKAAEGESKMEEKEQQAPQLKSEKSEPMAEQPQLQYKKNLLHDPGIKSKLRSEKITLTNFGTRRLLSVPERESPSGRVNIEEEGKYGGRGRIPIEPREEPTVVTDILQESSGYSAVHRPESQHDDLVDRSMEIQTDLAGVGIDTTPQLEQTRTTHVDPELSHVEGLFTGHSRRGSIPDILRTHEVSTQTMPIKTERRTMRDDLRDNRNLVTELARSFRRTKIPLMQTYKLPPPSQSYNNVRLVQLANENASYQENLFQSRF